MAYIDLRGNMFSLNLVLEYWNALFWETDLRRMVFYWHELYRNPCCDFCLCIQSLKMPFCFLQ